jgi:thioredoxin 1
MSQHSIPSANTLLPSASLLEPEEIHYLSCHAAETCKQWLGYQPNEFLRYTCHLTNQRLILEPQNFSSYQDWLINSSLASLTTNHLSTDNVQPVIQISIEAIAHFKVERGLNLKHYAKIVLKQPPQALVNGVVLALRSPEQENFAVEFVQTANQVFGLDPNQLMIPTASAKDKETIAAFQQQLSDSPVPILVNFVAPGCKPCKEFAPVIDEVIQQYENRLQIISIDIEKNVHIPMQYGIDCFPTLAIFKAGVLVDRIIGIIPKPILIKVLNHHLKAA